MSGWKARPYQSNAIKANHNFWMERGYNSVINHMATGLGKTAVSIWTAAELFPPDVNRVLFIANQRQLVRQTERAFQKYAPQITAQTWTKYSRPGLGVVMAERDDILARVVIATPQTLSGIEGKEDFERLDRMLKYGAFDLVIYDEAHGSVAQAYLAMHKRLLEANPKMKTLGLTATPLRNDGLALSQMYEAINVRYPIQWGIQNGYLCPILDPLEIMTNLEFNEDSSIEDQAKAIDVDNWSEILYNAWTEHAADRQAIAWFMPSVAHSIAFCRYMQERGVLIAHVDGEKCIDPHGNVSSASRDDILESFESGEFNHISNYNVLTTGWDCPRVDCIGLARPTTNPVLQTQILGRGTRLFPGKVNLLPLDFAVKGINLVTAGTLLGHTWREEEQPTEDADENAELEEISDGIDLRDLEERKGVGKGLVTRVGSLFKKKREAWYTDINLVSTLACSATDMLMIHPPNYTLAAKLNSGIKLGENKLEEDPNNEKFRSFYNAIVHAHTLFSNYTLWRVRGETRTNYKTGKEYVVWLPPTSWEMAEETIELLFDYAAPLQDELLDPAIASKSTRWRRGGQQAPPPSDAQVKMLKQYGVRELPYTKGEASQLISHYICIDKVMPTIEEIQKKAGRFGRIKSFKMEEIA